MIYAAPKIHVGCAGLVTPLQPMAALGLWATSLTDVGCPVVERWLESSIC